MLSARLIQSASTFGREFSKSVAMARLKVSTLEFQRKVSIDFKVKHFRVKTIGDIDELRQVLGLRHKVFKLEFSKKILCIASDWEPLDTQADHLVIVDEKSPAKPKIVGVYRLLHSGIARRFYSENEFDIGDFLSIDGLKLELSRACIDQDYRNGIVITLLWKGLAEYAKKINAEWLFGLSSIGTVSLDKIISIHRYFSEKNLIDRQYRILPEREFKIQSFDRAYLESPAATADFDIDLIPPLLKSYINAGAKICSQPVIDTEFACCDWFTILNLKQMANKYEKKFM